MIRYDSSGYPTQGYDPNSDMEPVDQRQLLPQMPRGQRLRAPTMGPVGFGSSTPGAAAAPQPYVPFLDQPAQRASFLGSVQRNNTASGAYGQQAARDYQSTGAMPGNRLLPAVPGNQSYAQSTQAASTASAATTPGRAAPIAQSGLPVGIAAPVATVKLNAQGQPAPNDPNAKETQLPQIPNSPQYEKSQKTLEANLKAQAGAAQQAYRTAVAAAKAKDPTADPNSDQGVIDTSTAVNRTQKAYADFLSGRQNELQHAPAQPKPSPGPALSSTGAPSPLPSLPQSVAAPSVPPGFAGVTTPRTDASGFNRSAEPYRTFGAIPGDSSGANQITEQQARAMYSASLQAYGPGEAAINDFYQKGQRYGFDAPTLFKQFSGQPTEYVQPGAQPTVTPAQPVPLYTSPNGGGQIIKMPNGETRVLGANGFVGGPVGQSAPLLPTITPPMPNGPQPGYSPLPQPPGATAAAAPAPRPVAASQPATQGQLGQFLPAGRLSGSPSQRQTARVSNTDDYARLPSGATYMDPQGNIRTKQ